jgi:hypothetical protein
MNSIFLLYVCDETVDSSYDLCSFPDSLKYPLLWIGTSMSGSVDNIIYDKRSIYNKCKNQKRYYSEYMEIFKYVERFETPLHPFSVKMNILETDILTKEILEERLMHYLLQYRVYHGDRLVLNPHYRMLLGLKITIRGEPLPILHDIRRERQNAKSKRYYLKHKEVIKARREQKKLALIENTAN